MLEIFIEDLFLSYAIVPVTLNSLHVLESVLKVNSFLLLVFITIKIINKTIRINATPPIIYGYINFFVFSLISPSNIFSKLILKSLLICFIKDISGIFLPFSHLLTA